jgi:hypothetical protein
LLTPTLATSKSITCTWIPELSPIPGTLNRLIHQRNQRWKYVLYLQLA